MQPIHLAIGIVEGMATAAVISFVMKAKPELSTTNTPTNRLIGTLGLLALLIGGIFSSIASSKPDGLEWSILRTAGTEELHATTALHTALERLQQSLALLPDYNLKMGRFDRLVRHRHKRFWHRRCIYRCNSNARTIHHEKMEKRSVIHAHMSNMKKRRHDVHPLSMLIITFTYIFVVASFHTYAFIELVPLSLYPITMIVFYRLSIRHIKRVLLASLPFITVIGLHSCFSFMNTYRFFIGV